MTMTLYKKEDRSCSPFLLAVLMNLLMNCSDAEKSFTKVHT